MDQQTMKGGVFTFAHPTGMTCVIFTEKPMFEIGNVVSSIEAVETLDFVDGCLALARHMAGKWGRLGPERWQRNEQALVDGDWVISLHTDCRGNDFGILTQPDRSQTWVVLVEECMRLGEMSTSMEVN